MEKKGVIKLLDEILIPLGFKRKSNNWITNGDVITKVVNLQKSQFGNLFYINYGFILNALPLDGLTTHIENRVAFSSYEENLRLHEMVLNLDSKLSDEERRREIRELIQNKVIPQIQSINTEKDILNELMKQPHLNRIPLVVKNYFNLK